MTISKKDLDSFEPYEEARRKFGRECGEDFLNLVELKDIKGMNSFRDRYFLPSKRLSLYGQMEVAFNDLVGTKLAQDYNDLYGTRSLKNTREFFTDYLHRFTLPKGVKEVFHSRLKDHYQI